MFKHLHGGNLEKAVEKYGISSEELMDQLAKKGILIRDCSNFRGLEKGKFIRVAVRTRKENIKLLKEIKSIS